MNEIFNSAEMRRFEKEQFLRKNSYFFMKQAGNQIFNFIKNKFKNKKSIIVLCGPGNNGGDGFIIARQLTDHGHPVKVYIYGNKSNYKGDALSALKEFKGEIKKVGLRQLHPQP